MIWLSSLHENLRRLRCGDHPGKVPGQPAGWPLSEYVARPRLSRADGTGL